MQQQQAQQQPHSPQEAGDAQGPNFVMPTPHSPQEAQEVSTERPQWLGTSAEQCQSMVDRATDRDLTVKFMLQRLEEVRLRFHRPFTPTVGSLSASIAQTAVRLRCRQALHPSRKVRGGGGGRVSPSRRGRHLPQPPCHAGLWSIAHMCFSPCGSLLRIASNPFTSSKASSFLQQETPASSSLPADRDQPCLDT